VTIFPVLNDLTGLEERGLIKTKVPESEISRIQEISPACKVIVK